jgi:hypothetical protein
MAAVEIACIVERGYITNYFFFFFFFSSSSSPSSSSLYLSYLTLWPADI